MNKLILTTIILSLAVPHKAQVGRFFSFLNNITVKDVSNLLRLIPIPNPLTLDGLPVGLNSVNYYLYTRKNPDAPVRLKQSSTSYTNLERQDEIKFIVHGWLEDANRTYYREMMNAYLVRGDYNVIGFDWQELAGYDYPTSSRNAKTAGRSLGDFIIQLNEITKIPYKQIHIVGHSLGAHVAGFAGKRVLDKTGQKLGRITGLDAAGPIFETPIPVSKENRLSKTDAEFVDCIHTDGGIYGMIGPIGHADFYPNSGIPRQPGCSEINTTQLSPMVIINDLFCSHARSHELFTESINSNGFKATLCDSYTDYKLGRCSGNQIVEMGENAPNTARGNFYLDTNPESPFAKS